MSPVSMSLSLAFSFHNIYNYPITGKENNTIFDKNKTKIKWDK